MKRRDYPATDRAGQTTPMPETAATGGAGAQRAAPSRAAAFAVPRWVTWITWVAILAPLPYSLERLLWAAGIPFGISESGLRDLGAPGWGSPYILLLALLAAGTAFFTYTFVLSRTRTVPCWIPILRNKFVRPRLVTAALLPPIAILTAANVQSAILLLLGDFPPDNSNGVAPWNTWVMAIEFWVWGITLTTATLSYSRLMAAPHAVAQP